MALNRNLFTNNRFAILYLVFGLFYINTTLTYAQIDNVALINGSLINTKTREPIQTTIIFIDESGKETKSKSEMNGQYQAVLTSGKRYTINCKDYIISDDQSEITLPAQKAYNEIRKNLELSKIEIGMKLLAIDAFTPNSEILNSNANIQMFKFKSFFDQNRNIKFKIFLSTEDSKTENTKSKAKSNSKKPAKVSAKDQLIQKRTLTLQDKLKSLKIPDNAYTIQVVDILSDRPLKAAPKVKKASKNTPIKNDTSIKPVTLKIEIDSINEIGLNCNIYFIQHKRTEKIYGIDMATSDPVPEQKTYKCIVFKCDELGKINFAVNLKKEIEIIKERVFSALDPYGEEDWEEN